MGITRIVVLVVVMLGVVVVVVEAVLVDEAKNAPGYSISPTVATSCYLPFFTFIHLS